MADFGLLASRRREHVSLLVLNPRQWPCVPAAPGATCTQGKGNTPGQPRSPTVLSELT